MLKHHKKIGVLSFVVLLLVVVAIAKPWVSGQLIAWKVKRQIDLLDQHPALSVLERDWHSGYTHSGGHIVMAERIGCGVKACSETYVSLYADHGKSGFGLGDIVVEADLNGLLDNALSPPVAPLHIRVSVGLRGHSYMQISMPGSWHQLYAERADAIAFSGIDASFTAKHHAQKWQGDIDASFTVISKSASAGQRERMSEMMQSLGTTTATKTEQVGSVIVRVIALMKELSAAIQVWQGKALSWNSQLVDPDTIEINTGLQAYQAQLDSTIKPLNLELQPTPGGRGAAGQKTRKLALTLPSFEAWHGQIAMPEAISRLEAQTREAEPKLDIWRINMQWRGDKLTLNGITVWQDN